MGLLRSIGRRAGRFAERAGDEFGHMWGHNTPIAASAGGALLGAGIGAAAGAPSGEMGQGALQGAAIGAGAMGGINAASAVFRGLSHGVAEMLRMAPYTGAGFETAKAKIAQRVAGFAGDSGMPLLQGVAREDAQAAAQQLMSARNADEMLQIAERLETGGGNAAAAMGRAYGMSRF